jgi:hypothetical protein
VTMTLEQFERQIKEGLAPLAGQEIQGVKVLFLSSDIGPWLDTGLALAAGDRVTLVLDGKVWLSRALNLSFEAPMAVWARIGEDGEVFRGVQATNTCVATTAGSLYLKLYPGERWLDAKGHYLGEPASINPDAGGGVSVALILWRHDADVRTVLRQLIDSDATAWWAAGELERQTRDARQPPVGWHYLWELGSSPVYAEVTPARSSGAPARAIDLHTCNDTAILQKDVSIELTPTTELLWTWKADRLPSTVAEDTLPTHDYMSIAVEFDNGRDLTFFWSHEMAVDQSFSCPLPGWNHRETHVVARSGTAELGKWIDEKKNIQDYYAKAVGGDIPKRIVRVWLIGVSLFQKGEGSSQIGNIVLTDGNKFVRVY